MTKEEKKRLEEEKAQQEATDRAIAYARSVGYDVQGQQAPATQPEQPVTQPTTLPNAQNGADALNLNAPATVQTPTPTQATANTTPAPAANPSQPYKLGSQEEEYSRYYNDVRTAGEAAIEAQENAARETAAFRRQQLEDRKRADDAEWQKVLEGQKTLQQYWVERNNEAKAEAQRAAEEDRLRTDMENRRAGLVGAGEVAASLINLFSVGQLHASNQVYKDHMQDWMRKADQDRRIRQLRIDQLKDRQRALGDKLAGLKAANTEAQYNYYLQQAAKEDKAKAEIAALEAAAPVQSAQARANLAGDLGKIGTTGAGQVASEKLRREQMAQNEAHFRANMAAQGRNADGTPNEEYIEKNIRAAEKVSGGGGGNKTKAPMQLHLIENREKNLPEEYISIPDSDTLYHNLVANIESIDDLSPRELNTIKSVLDDPTEKAENKRMTLERYIGKSAQLRDAVRMEQRKQATYQEKPLSILADLQGDGSTSSPVTIGRWPSATANNEPGSGVRKK